MVRLKATVVNSQYTYEETENILAIHTRTCTCIYRSQDTIVPSVLDTMALLTTAWATARAMSGIPPTEMNHWGKKIEPTRGLSINTAGFGCMWIVL